MIFHGRDLTSDGERVDCIGHMILEFKSRDNNISWEISLKLENLLNNHIWCSVQILQKSSWWSYRYFDTFIRRAMMELKTRYEARIACCRIWNGYMKFITGEDLESRSWQQRNGTTREIKFWDEAFIKNTFLQSSVQGEIWWVRSRKDLYEKDLEMQSWQN